MPGEGVGQITPDRGTQSRRQVQDRRDYYHDRRQIWLAEFCVHDRKHGGCHGTAAEPLDCPVDDHLAESSGCRAQGTGRGKADGRGHKQYAGRQQTRQHAGQRNHHDIGDQIRGLNPGDFVGAGRQPSLDLGQRAGDDLDIHDRHEQADDHGEDADPVAQTRCRRLRDWSRGSEREPGCRFERCRDIRTPFDPRGGRR